MTAVKVNKAPCRNCDKRKVGCHSTCPDYISYDKQNQINRDERYKRLTKDLIMFPRNAKIKNLET